MEATNSAQVLEGIYDASEEELIPLAERETMERDLDHYYEPSYRSNCVLLFLMVMISCLHLQLPKSEGF
jgi:hypothetical protein